MNLRKPYALLFKVLYIGLLMGFVYSCQPSDGEPQTQIGSSQKQTPQDTAVITLEALRAMDAQITKAEALDPQLGIEAMGMFIKYVRTHPQDTLNPMFTYKAAHIARNVPGRGLKAVQYFTEVYETYPEHKLAPEAMLMAGMVWDENFKDSEKAIVYFQKVIETYPDHYTAINAMHLIEMRVKEQSDLDWVHTQQVKKQNK